MSVTTLESTGSTSRRISWFAIASLLCGLAMPIIGVPVLQDVGSDISDLLTLTLLPLLIATVVLCILAYGAVWKTPERLTGKGYAIAGPILAAWTIGAGYLLIPAT